MAKKRVRLPGPKDLDQYGRARIVVTDRLGRKKVRYAAAPDAREIIMTGSGTLDVPEELAREEDAAEARNRELGGYGLKQLREFCKALRIPFTGKPESELRRLLLAKGFAPPNEPETEVAEIETSDEDDLDSADSSAS